MEKKEFDLERLKRRLNYLLKLSSEDLDLFDCGYCSAIKKCQSIIDEIEND